MFKKSLASVVSAAILVAGPGNLTLTAAAQTMSRGPVSGVSVTPTIGTGFNSPVPGASSFNVPTLTPGSLIAPSLLAAPSLAPAPIAAVPAALSAAVVPAAAKAVPASVKGSPLSVIKSQDASVGVTEKGAALDALFENSLVTGQEALEVLGQSAASVESGLSRSEAASAKSPIAIERAALQKGAAAGSLSDLGNLIKRAWNAVLGMLGIGVKKMETPEVMAQRIIDQLNAAKPVYNRKVKEASTLVEALRLQVEGETKKVAELEQGITALLSDSDPANDIMASGMINQQKTLNGSITATNEQTGLAEKTLEGIKEERARFFSEREETIAKIQAGLTKAAAADIQKQIAELKGGFQIGDLKDNLDKFEDAVNDKVADAKGTVDSVESNPDQILKKAKDSLKSQEIKDELARRKAAIEQAKKDKGQAGGLLLELGIGAAVVAVIALVSAPFRNILSRAWNVFLGLFGMGVKKMETPEVMAQRIVDQLNAQKPVYNRKVQEASTLVEKLRLQIEKQTAQSQDLDRSVTAILSDSDPLNDVMAESLLNQKKTVDASTTMTQEQLALSEKTLVDIKEERARFFSEREEMLAKIQSGLTKSKSAEIQKQIAELKGGFQVGDLKDNMDKFEDAVNDKVADAKGTVDSVDSNPDQILKKAKDSLKNAEVQDEIAKRKAAIEAAKKAKGSAGGDASQSKALGYFAKVVGVGFALISPWLSAAVFSALGLVAIAMAPAQGRWLGRQLAVIGLGTLVIGGAASLAVAKLGLAFGAFGVGVSFLVPAGIALSIGVIATIRASKKENATLASVASTPAGSSVMTPAPTLPTVDAEPAKGSSPKASFSIKPLIDLLARAWNAVLGVLGMGVKKMETPEILAQRLIDQLNAAKPVYNNKVREASTLVEKLRQQITGEQAKIADFDKTITALLSDNDASNDIQAAGLLNSQKTLEASVADTQEQLAAGQRALENIKEERARFFSEREETLAKIQSGLTKVKSAEISKQIAELKGGFQIGDLKDNLDRFDGAVADKIADAKGTVDSAESNPDQVLKKAKDSLRTAEIADELAKRKAAIEAAKKDKGAAGGAVSQRDLSMKEIFVLNLVGIAVSIAAGFLLHAPLIGLLGTFVAPIPVIFAYVGVLRLMGAEVKMPGIRFAPGISWGGKRDAGGLLLELGIGAAVIAVIAAVSAPFRNLLARTWNALLGIFGMGVKKMETPEVMAQRIIDQLNSQKPIYNRKVQEASTLVEKLRLQIEKQEAQSSDLDKSVTAILSDSDPLNDVMAESLLNQKKTVDASTTLTKEQLAISEKTLVDIKEERARFFSEREEMLAKIQSGLTKSKSAEIQKQIAELKGGFQVGDLKDNMDKFEDAVNDKVADAKGTVDSVDSNPDQILKKAKDSLKNAEVQDEIAKRKAAIEAARKAKGSAGGFVVRGNLAKGLIVYALGAGFIAAVLGFIPGFAPLGLLDTALRFLGVMAVWAGMDGIEYGGGSSTVRSTLMVGAGVATILAAAGVFGALGGLTAFALGLTGFFFTWRGIVRFASSKK